MDKESDFIKENVAKTPCPKCGGKLVLNGSVCYSAPPLYELNCSKCNAFGRASSGDCGIDVITLPKDKEKEAYRLAQTNENEYRAFMKLHGVKKPRQFHFTLTMNS